MTSEKRKEINKRYYEKHKEEINKRRRNKRKKMKANFLWKTNKKEYYKDYYQKNRDHKIKIIMEKQKEYRKNNIAYRIKKSLITRLNQVIRKKTGHTTEFLGCDIDFFLSYIESKFQEGMTWDNYGLFGWHIDHIRPCASFNLLNEEEQKACFHYTNLQPLWAEENIRKSDIWEVR